MDLLNNTCPKSIVIYTFQVIAVLSVMITSLVNLTLSHQDKGLWLSLLTSSLAYLLPNPYLKKKTTSNNKKDEHHHKQGRPPAEE